MRVLCCVPLVFNYDFLKLFLMFKYSFLFFFLIILFFFFGLSSPTIASILAMHPPFFIIIIKKHHATGSFPKILARDFVCALC